LNRILQKSLSIALIIPVLMVMGCGKGKEVDVEAEILLAKEHIMLGRYEEAISLLKELAKANPENAAIYYLLGTAYEEANLNELSVEAFVKALQIDPDIESKIGYE